MADSFTQNTGILRSMILGSGNIVLVTHARPDGDALGSTIGLATYIESLGRKPKIILPDRWPETLEFIFMNGRESEVVTYAEQQQAADELISSADLIICLDMSGFSRTEKMSGSLASAGCRKVLIDHHKKPERECFDLCFSETEISSASELTYDIMMNMPEIEADAGKISEEGRRALLTGMTTDTNNFNNSTFPSTFKMASAIIAAGTDRDEILLHINNEYKERRLRLMGNLLYNVMKITADGVAYMILDQEMKDSYGIDKGDTEGFVNIPLSIKEVKMSIFLRADEDGFRVSTRSKKGVSARLLNERFFNGGGHEQAAGGNISYQTVPTAEAAAAYIERVTDIFFNSKE